ncbi:MAG: methylglyoxal synthase [Lachnospiraceae bacterium]|nr:methylglyoxal synthase [Lachnospiraceae bacterium]
MNVGIIAHNAKKDLIQDFCIAYKKLLERHRIIATGNTGRRIEEVTKLPVVTLLPGSLGGDRQFIAQIERQELGLVIFFYNPYLCDETEPNVDEITRLCDLYNIPIATNIGTAEVLVLNML